MRKSIYGDPGGSPHGNAPPPSHSAHPQESSAPPYSSQPYKNPLKREYEYSQPHAYPPQPPQAGAYGAYNQAPRPPPPPPRYQHNDSSSSSFYPHYSQPHEEEFSSYPQIRYSYPGEPPKASQSQSAHQRSNNLHALSRSHSQLFPNGGAGQHFSADYQFLEPEPEPEPEADGDSYHANYHHHQRVPQPQPFSHAYSGQPQQHRQLVYSTNNIHHSPAAQQRQQSYGSSGPLFYQPANPAPAPRLVSYSLPEPSIPDLNVLLYDDDSSVAPSVTASGRSASPAPTQNSTNADSSPEQERNVKSPSAKAPAVPLKIPPQRIRFFLIRKKIRTINTVEGTGEFNKSQKKSHSKEISRPPTNNPSPPPALNFSSSALQKLPRRYSESSEAPDASPATQERFSSAQQERGKIPQSGRKSAEPANPQDSRGARQPQAGIPSNSSSPSGSDVDDGIPRVSLSSIDLDFVRQNLKRSREFRAQRYG